MKLDDIIASRQSCRAYDPDRPVRREDLTAMVEAARLAPSACNSQTWRFVVVTGRETLDAVYHDGMRLGVGNHFLREAPALIVGCSRLDLLANTVGRAVSGIDYFQVDLGIAMEHMALKAVELGLATCWIGWFDQKSIRKILSIPRSVRVTALLAVGYAREPAVRAKQRKPLDEIFMWERWSG